MNVSILLLIALPIFWIAYRYYARYLANIFGENPAIPPPSVTLKDDVDFVPTHKSVLFGHHFASIAGGGPIIGPAIAAAFGYIPVFLWLVIGSVFIGAAHDYSALFISIREKGKSMAEVAKSSLGKFGFFLFIAFTIVMLLLVTSSFLDLTATALTSVRSIKELGLPAGQTVLKTFTDPATNVVMCRIGGIASTSVIVITCCAPLIGFLLYKRNISVLLASALSLIVCSISIYIGLSAPVTLNPDTWKIILAIYTLFAAGAPVWIILQPRDFMNSFILYVGIVTLAVGIFAGGLHGVQLSAPAFNLKEAASLPGLGMIWPFLFITVACGAISGFHALVAGGTSSKQISNEADARPIAFGGMIVESILAVGVLIAVCSGISFADYKQIVFPAVESGLKSNPILAFSSGMGGLLHKGLGIPAVFGTIFGILLVEGFVATTLDTAVRLNRYLIEELWSFIFKKVPSFLKSYLFNAGIAVLAMYLLARFNTYKIIWPLFGTANQLLAALTLIVVAVWLTRRKKPTWFVTLPAAFMLATTAASLLWLLFKNYLPQHNYPLVAADILLIILSFGVLVLSLKVILNGKKQAA
ncbi:MAG: carbon starvation protein A [bacterium]